MGRQVGVGRSLTLMARAFISAGASSANHRHFELLRPVLPLRSRFALSRVEMGALR